MVRARPRFSRSYRPGSRLAVVHMPTPPACRVVAVTGESMRFLISPGDEVAVVMAKPEDMAAGDIALLFDARPGMGGRPVVHRVMAPCLGARGAVLTTKGDASWTIDEYGDGMLLVGRVVAVRKRGRWRRIHGRATRWLWRLPALYSPPALALLRGFFIAWRSVLTLVDSRLDVRGRAEFARFGEGILLPWALRSLELLPMSLLGEQASDVPSPEADRERVRFGSIDHDETWKGTIRVIGDVVVRPGVTLTLEQGTRVNFEEISRYRSPFPFGRSGREGVRWVGPERPRLLVYGRLEARGGKDGEVCLTGPGWGGLHVLGEGDVRLGPQVEIAGSGLSAWDASRLTLEECRIAGGSEGVVVRGRASAELRGGSVSSAAGPAMVIEDSAALESDGVEVRGGGGPSVRATGGQTRVRGGVLMCAGDASVIVSGQGRVLLQGVRVTSDKKAAVSIGGGGSVTLTDCRLEGAEGGAFAIDSDGELSGSRVAAFGTVDLGGSLGPGSRLKLDDSSVTAPEVALAIDGGEASLKTSQLESRRGVTLVLEGAARVVADGLTVKNASGSAIKIGERCFLEADKSSFSSGEACLVLDRGTAVLRDVTLRSKESFGLELEKASVSFLRVSILSEGGQGAVLRGGSLTGEGISISAAQGACEVSEGGRLSLRDGTLRGGDFGLRCVDGATSLGDLRVDGGRLIGVDLQGGEHRFRGIVVESAGGRGAAIKGGSLSGEGVSVSAALGACEVSGGGRLSLRGGTLRGGDFGLRCVESLTILSEVSLQAERGHGAELAGGSLTGKDVSISAAQGACEVSKGGRLSLRDGTLRGGDFGLRCVAGSTSLKGIGVQGGRLIGVDLQSGDHHFDEVVIESEAGPGAALKGGSLTGEGVSISTALGACEVSGGGRLSLRGGTLRGGDFGLRCVESSTILSGVTLQAERGHGAELVGGLLTGEGVSISAAHGACEVSKGGRLSLGEGTLRGVDFGLRCVDGSTDLKNINVEGGRLIGVDLRSGEHGLDDVSLTGCAEPGVFLNLKVVLKSRNVVIGGKTWLDPRLLPLSGGLFYRSLLSFTLATRGSPFFKEAYRAVAGAVVALSTRALACSRIVSDVFVYRGWIEGDWQAGISDIDLQCVFASGQKDESMICGCASFFSIYRRLRGLFPLLGEILICSKEELSSYVRDGGARAEEFVRTGKSLRGVGRIPEPPARENPVASVTEALHAYSRMMAVRFPGEIDHPERSRQNMRKAFLDVFRYCRRAGVRAPAVSRGVFEASLRLSRPDLAAALDCDDRDALCAGACKALDEACTPLLAVGPTPPPTRSSHRPGVSAGKLEEVFHRALDSFTEDLGMDGIGFSLEDGHRFELILPASFEEDRVGAICRHLDEMRQRHSFLRTLPLPLSRRAWEFLQQSPYRHHPTAFLDCAAADGRVMTGGRGLLGFLRLRRGVPVVERRLSASHFNDSVVQSLRHLDLCWREMFFSVDSRKAAYHLYTRALGLRLLLEGGVAAPFTEMEAVLAEARERFVDARAWLDGLDLCEVGERMGDLRAHYPFISRQLEMARRAALSSERAAIR